MSHWAKTATGYELDGHVLTRRGRICILTTAAGVEHDLGTRATFDHAEAAIVSAAN